MPDTQITENEHSRRSQRVAHIVGNQDDNPQTPSDVGSISQHAAISLANGSLAGRANMGLRAHAMQQMQRTHGNRAVQRRLAANTFNGHVAVQRSPSPTETLQSLEQTMGKDNPGLDYLRKQMGMQEGGSMHTLEALRQHGLAGPGLDYMAGQMGMRGTTDGHPLSNGPGAYADRNSAGGLDVGFGVAHDVKADEVVDVGFAEGKLGAWDEDGGTQYGIKANAGLARVRSREDVYEVSGGMDLLTAGAEFSGGENGVRAQAGATAFGVEGTLGGFDKERNDDLQARGGLSIGPSLGARLHWGDSDHDGHREYGVGADIGPVSFDVKSEDPIRAYMGLNQDTLPGQNMTDMGINSAIDIAGDFIGLPSGPSEKEQQENQAAFIAKRDKELAGIEKNKEQIMKEQGPQAYYHKMTVANLPPQVRNLVEAAP